jgi:hypothetical protein
LIEIALNEVQDVRKALRRFRDQMLRGIASGIQKPHLVLKLEQDLDNE